MRRVPVAVLLVVAVLVAGCGVLGIGNAPCRAWWREAGIAFHGHTNLEAVGLTAGWDFYPPDLDLGQRGELWVSAEPFPVYSPVGPQPFPVARQYCFVPDGSSLNLFGTVRDDWQPPGE